MFWWENLDTQQLIAFVIVILIKKITIETFTTAMDDDGLRREDIDAAENDLRQGAQQSWLSPAKN